MNFLLFGLCVFSTTAFASLPPPPNAQELEYNKTKAVTYASHGGRFGDQLLCYIHAKWISYYYGIPLLYKPFPYSDQLFLHRKENTNVNTRQLHPIPLSLKKNIDFNRKKKDLYIIPYFPESQWELTKGSTKWYHFPVDWKDERFKEELRQLIRPLYPTSFLDLPTDRVSIALHVRKGGGFDTADTWKGYPMKFPPQSYYVEQLKKISEIFPGQPLYVYVFTDHTDPVELIDEYQQSLDNVDIQFDCRKKDNHHTSNVIEDFFEMMRFDCLIAADSNFSIIPSKLGNYKVIITPKNFQQTENIVYINEVNIEISSNTHQN